MGDREGEVLRCVFACCIFGVGQQGRGDGKEFSLVFFDGGGWGRGEKGVSFCQICGLNVRRGGWKRDDGRRIVGVVVVQRGGVGWQIR